MRPTTHKSPSADMGAPLDTGPIQYDTRTTQYGATIYVCGRRYSSALRVGGR